MGFILKAPSADIRPKRETIECLSALIVERLREWKGDDFEKAIALLEYTGAEKESQPFCEKSSRAMPKIQ